MYETVTTQKRSENAHVGHQVEYNPNVLLAYIYTCVIVVGQVITNSKSDTHFSEAISMQFLLAWTTTSQNLHPNMWG